ncbi:acyl CoA:acetate/3-ketoacid CoA transferase [Galbibacter mesophilus]|uniref:acyl CoA:acetate/3-ketoacid CoA transferase n=1 Tax=Galbibacter mesophilus TaxID=379069 RepID=UPI0019200FA9|nr:malonate decarboxylase subunit alpha [Galbibacter mesophilus]MCM5664343.1 malonate decarboxylase subunit alpha [Galbibacter mesophilus]
MFKIVDAKTAAEKINDGDTLAIGGAGAGHAVPDTLLRALGERFKTTGHPKKITSVHPCGVGDNDQRGLNHIALEGLIDTDFGGFWGNAPKMVQLARENKIKGYNFPQGILSHLMRASASKKPGVISKVGLNTFVDPRIEGGKINQVTKKDHVQVMAIDDEEYLFYKSFKIDVAFIRGTSIDSEGNITMEEEVGSFAMFSIAQAAKTNGGIVIAQVKNVVDGNCDPGRVKIPGFLVDYVVVEPNQEMTFLSKFDPALVKRDAPYTPEELPLEGPKRIIMRRAALELKKGAFVNLGYGMSDGVPIIAQQENILDELTFMIEQGASAGIPTTGLNFGAMYNPSSIVDDGYQFDFFQGGGLDIAYLGFAQIDKNGNVNSSRFGNVLTGCGGFIDISQNAKKVVFTGTFAVKSTQNISEKGVEITHPGKFKKFVDAVEQITFSGRFAMEKGQEVFYVTERAVFKLTKGGLELIELAPLVDLQKDVLDMMDFEPLISKELKSIDSRIYKNEYLNLKETFS